MKKYQIIYADPPWNYKVYSKKGLGRSAESHYPTMSIEDIFGKYLSAHCWRCLLFKCSHTDLFKLPESFRLHKTVTLGINYWKCH